MHHHMHAVGLCVDVIVTTIGTEAPQASPEMSVRTAALYHVACAQVHMLKALSGGQKSIVALAFIFAIQVRGAPAKLASDALGCAVALPWSAHCGRWWAYTVSPAFVCATGSLVVVCSRLRILARLRIRRPQIWGS